MIDKVRSFVRLVVARELTPEEITQFFDIVDAHSLTDTLTTFDSEGNSQDETAITLMVQDKSFIYEISTVEDLDSADSRSIAEEFASIISDDFELAASFS